MRIAIWHNLPSGGGKRALYDQVAGFLRAGHHVESWCPPSADQSFLPLGRLVAEHVVPLQSTTVGSRLRFRDPWPSVVRRLRAMDEHCRRVASDVNRKDFDVLFAGSCMEFRVTSIGAHVTTATVMYLQEPNRWLYEAMPTLPWMATEQGRSLRAISRRFTDAVRVESLRVQVREERRNIQAFDRVLVSSLFSRENVLRAYGLQARVCRLGVDASRWRSGGQAKRRRIVAGLGAFVPEKRVDAAIRAISLLPSPRPPLVWFGNAGDPNYIADLARIAEAAGVDFRPKVAVEHDEVTALLRTSAVMVYVPRLEPFGLAPLEAGACGLPVVASAEGGVRETVIDGLNGWLVEGDDESVAEGLHRVLSDPHLAAEMGRRAIEHVEQNWSSDAADARLEAQLRAAVDTTVRP